MIEETYVAFKQAKLLKEKGFPQRYSSDNEIRSWYYKGGKNYPIDEKDTSLVTRPTLSLVQKWLREEKGIIVDVCSFSTTVKDNLNVFMWQYLLAGNTWHHNISGSRHNTYEEALSEGINKALELI